MQDTSRAWDSQTTRPPGAGSSGGAPATTALRPGGVAAAVTGGGLVTCAKTRRDNPEGLRPAGFPFPDLDEVRAGAASIGDFAWDGREGPVPMVEVAPGLIRLTAPDLNRREKAWERAARRRQIDSVAEIRAEMADSAEETLSPTVETERQVRGWSRKSRARMVATMAELDLAPILLNMNQPAMVTLTYPGKWEDVAPDGPTVKKHFEAFCKRYKRSWGENIVCVWKLEFQRRGAPHIHILMSPPTGKAGAIRRETYEMAMLEWEAGGRQGRKPRHQESQGDGLAFRPWLSLVWATIVGAEDEDEFNKHLLAGTGIDYAEGDRARDPKRAAVYFGKHGTFAAKDYQHNVPELWRKSGKSVGRFWGYRGLRKIKGAANLDYDSLLFLGRVLRKYGTRTKVWDEQKKEHFFRPVLRTEYRPRGRRLGFVVSPDGVVVERRRLRRQTVRARRMTGAMATGFLLVSDGPAMARTLSRALESCRSSNDEAPAPVGLRGPIWGRV